LNQIECFESDCRLWSFRSITITPIQTMGDSPLFGDAPPPDEDPADAPPPQPAGKKPAFGNLKRNDRAKGRREQVKFFDSADWAMKKEGEAADGAAPPPGSAPQPVMNAFPQNDAESTLLSADAPDSFLASGE
jgi:hypothetical protein